MCSSTMSRYTVAIAQAMVSPTSLAYQMRQPGTLTFNQQPTVHGLAGPGGIRCSHMYFDAHSYIPRFKCTLLPRLPSSEGFQARKGFLSNHLFHFALSRFPAFTSLVGGFQPILKFQPFFIFQYFPCRLGHQLTGGSTGGTTFARHKVGQCESAQTGFSHQNSPNKPQKHKHQTQRKDRRRYKAAKVIGPKTH